MVTDFHELFLAGRGTLYSVGLETIPLNMMGAPWIVYDNSVGHMSKSTVIDTFWHGYQRVETLAALNTERILGIVSFN